MDKPSVGFIGLGEMGRPMAQRLLDHGHAVTSCAHKRRENIEALKAHGLVEAATAHDAALGADVVITMVRDTAESEAVIEQERGVLDAMRDGTTLIIMSTVDPGFCQRLTTEASIRNIAVIDAPVSGFYFRAVEGTLAIMTGGDEAAIEAQRPLLETMGAIHLCGGPGMGQVAKLSNNTVVLGVLALLREARAFARGHGMAEDDLMNILQNASADGFLVRNWDAVAPVWDNIMELAIKDGATCLAAAKARNQEMPVAQAMFERIVSGD
jgi:3-hydroxyisobutyrate dehydrogenase-like beta-hydroxyacid dehydrogenase